MNDRAAALFRTILSKEYGLTISELMDAFHISERTLRRDLKEINSFVKSFGLPTIRTVGTGEVIVPGNVSYAEAIRHVQSMDDYEYRLSIEQRVALELLVISRSHDALPSSTLAERLSMSRNSTFSDLERCRVVAEHYGVELVSTRGRGFELIGSELQIRIMLCSLIGPMMLPGKSPTFASLIQREMAPEHGYAEVSRCVGDMERYLDAPLQTEVFSSLVNYLFFTLDRISLGYEAKNENDYLSEPLDPIATQAARAVERNISIVLSDSEKVLCSRFLKVIHNDEQAAPVRSYKDAYALAQGLATALDGETAFDFSHDQRLIDALAAHIQSMSKGSASGFGADEALMMIEGYPQVFKAVKNCSRLLERWLGHPVDDTELGYITMHFCASALRATERSVPLRIAVVCQEKRSVGELVAGIVRNRFGLVVAAILTASKREELKNVDHDFVISIGDVYGYEKPFIKVGSVLTPADFANIAEMIDRLSAENESITGNFDQTIDNIRSRYRALGHTSIAAQFLQELDEVCIRYETREGSPSEELVSPSLCSVVKSVPSRRQALFVAGKMLMDEGCISTPQLTKAVDDIGHFGPYIAITKGVALAAVNSATDRAKMSVLVIHNGVSFHSINDPVYCVLMVATAPALSTAEAQKRIMAMCSRKGMVKKLRYCTKPDEVCSTFSSMWEETL